MSTPNPDRARALVTASLGAVVFFALVIVGFGALSYATRTDPIGEPGLGPLPGVLGVVLSAAGCEVHERAVSLDECGEATEVFVTNALRGARPVGSVRGVGRWEPGPVTARAQRLLADPR